MNRVGFSWASLVSWLRRSRVERDEFACDDCGMLTAPIDAPDEWYTVHDEIWKDSGKGEDGILCIGCLEARIGRMLEASDFMSGPLNDPDYGWHSDRLRARLTET